ncbi:MAG TPA: FlgD immunoglobulin-like domain containing protein [bacterium]|nr:FlgD immunoglobulin-like domain containing protein [bacterium]HQG45544.1 FlgD immunoglobulin-like domain containing protein [bacterium]HQI47236.1 FlgD immunoglobulin-like domain containing protein [bacterium]HQJ65138.1 FlgD immunoglobulin-like domain containing protein [bacterium]
MKHPICLIILMAAPLLLQAGPYTLKRDGFVSAGGRVASTRYAAVTAAGRPTFSGMESPGFSVGPVTAVALPPGPVPASFALAQNYPNPFNQSTTLSWQLPVAAEVRITLYSLRGEEVALLYAGRQPAGLYRLSWTGNDAAGHPLPSGLYFVHFTAGGRRQVVKVTLVR